MLVSFNWLKEVSPHSFSPDELADKLTAIGLEVCDRKKVNQNIPGIKIGRITSIQGHPNADRLNCVKVEIQTENDKGIIDVVCGANNIQENSFILLATEGTTLPNGMKMKKTSIRGVDSSSMICSKQELALETSSEGVWILPPTTEITQNYSDIIGQEDVIYDIDLTSNRSDCQSIIGVAREVSIISGKYKNNDELPKILRGTGNIDIEINNNEACPRYTAQIIHEVTVKESPDWLKNRLNNHGLRPINNIVDITNYMMLLHGQPMHAFDLSKIKKSEIIVRNAKKGETLKALDNKHYDLNENHVVIADVDNPLAIAGIIGGEESSVTEKTTDILIEVANFDPAYIRKVSRLLKINTDSSTRFSRPLDMSEVANINHRATAMVLELAGGKCGSALKDIFPKKIKQKEINFDYEEIIKILGIKIDISTVNNILASIGCEIKQASANHAKVVVPYYRHDLNYSWDLVEEVARIYGYDNFPESIPPISNNNYQLPYRDTNNIIQKLTGLSYQQIINDSFVENDFVQKYKLEDQQIKISNPVTPDIAYLKNGHIFSSLKTLKYNLDQKNESFKAFEVGNCFESNEKGPLQKLKISLCLSGKINENAWNRETQNMDIFHLKGDLEELMAHFKVPFKISPIECPYFTDKQSFEIKLKNTSHVGYFGKVNKKTSKYFQINQDCYFAELDYDSFFSISNKMRIKDYSSFPDLKRDFAIVCPIDTNIPKIQNYINQFSPLIKENKIVDIYSGKELPENYRSIVFSIAYNNPSQTLKKEEVESIESKLATDVINKFNVQLR